MPAVSLRRQLASFQSDNVSHDTGKTEKLTHEGSTIDRNIFVLPSPETTKPCSFTVLSCQRLLARGAGHVRTDVPLLVPQPLPQQCSTRKAPELIRWPDARITSW